jgi:hypothetical protein
VIHLRNFVSFVTYVRGRPLLIGALALAMLPATAWAKGPVLSGTTTWPEAILRFFGLA